MVNNRNDRNDEDEDEAKATMRVVEVIQPGVDVIKDYKGIDSLFRAILGLTFTNDYLCSTQNSLTCHLRRPHNCLPVSHTHLTK